MVRWWRLSGWSAGPRDSAAREDRRRLRRIRRARPRPSVPPQPLRGGGDPHPRRRLGAAMGSETRVVVRGRAAYHTWLEGGVMKDVVSFLQNLDALAFVLLGVATAVGWTRRRDRSLLWLALAIILLSFVSLLGRIPALLHITVPLVPEVSLVAFMGSGYALLRYRASLIPLSPRWHGAAVVAMAGGRGALLAAHDLLAPPP